MKKIVFYIIFFPLLTVAQQPMEYKWSYVLERDYSEPYDMLIDSNGNIITTGNFIGLVDFDPGVSNTNTNAYNGSLFLKKTDANGNLNWIYHPDLSNSGVDHSFGVSYTNSGFYYITGSFDDTIDFIPGPNTYEFYSSGWDDALVAKIDTSGNFIWAKVIGGNGSDAGLGVTTDDNDNVYFTGRFTDTVDLDPGSGTDIHIATGNSGCFVTKLDSSGNFLWSKSISSPEGSYIEDINMNSIGELVITGYFMDTLDLDPGAGTDYIIAPFNQSNTFILKLDSSGNYIKGGSFYSKIVNRSLDTRIDAHNNIYLTGVYRDTIDFDPGIGTHYEYAPYSTAAVSHITKLNNNLELVWVRTISDTAQYNSNIGGTSIAISKDDIVYSSGTFGAHPDMDPGPGTYYLPNGSEGVRDIYIHKMDSSGNFIWAGATESVNFAGFPSSEHFSALAVADNGDLYCAGHIDDSTQVDPNNGNILHYLPYYGWSNDRMLMLCLKESETTNVNKTDDKLFASIYPNPFSGELNITLKKNQYSTVTIYNAVGKTIIKKQFNTKNIHLNTDIPRGLYLLEIETDNGIITRKLIKE